MKKHIHEIKTVVKTTFIDDDSVDSSTESEFGFQRTHISDSSSDSSIDEISIEFKKKRVSKPILSPRISDNKKFEYTQREKDFVNLDFKNLCGSQKYTPAILPAKSRIIVFGDIHGDLRLAINMFINSGLAIYDRKTKNIKWIGKNTVVVQVGDQIDRCRPVPGIPCTDPLATLNDENNDVAILELFNTMASQAQKEGGDIISLLGNHELLNAMGRLEYVSYQGVKQFESYKDPKDPKLKFADGKSARIHAFKPGNEYASMMGCTRLPAVIIGTNLFVHAGIIDALIEEINLNGLEDFERINIKIRMWLLGLIDQEYVEEIIRYSKTSMFWSRILGKIPPGVDIKDPQCIKNIKNVLELFRVGSLIIGHTPQSFMYNEDINSTCSGKVWRVDNGSSGAFDSFDMSLEHSGKINNNRRMQYLEIINDSTYFVCDKSGCKREISITK